MVSELRLATPEDGEAVMLVQAEMALAAGGVNPMETDLPGFRKRCARRIELERTWVWREGQDLIFKVDIMADTPEAFYLEGVWVNPRERRKDYGLRCLTQLGRKLLRETASLCVLVNENNVKACALYRRAGFKPRGAYQSAFLQSQPPAQKAGALR
jgi:predicted GNAT family acetyltransferase